MKTRNRNFFNIKNGFTLAEVLITLVIIGVIAALAISPLINTYVESSTVSKVKKGLSILGQAKKLAELQNGPIEGWEFGVGKNAETAAQFWNYLKPHISVAKDCGSSTDCYISVPIKKLNGSDWVNYNTQNMYYKLVLADGSVMWFRMEDTGKCLTSASGINNVCSEFWYDVNGDKSPNTLGKDVFLYAINVDGVYPAINGDCNKSSDGFGCSGYIIQHNDMKYLH